MFKPSPPEAENHTQRTKRNGGPHNPQTVSKSSFSQESHSALSLKKDKNNDQNILQPLLAARTKRNSPRATHTNSMMKAAHPKTDRKSSPHKRAESAGHSNARNDFTRRTQSISPRSNSFYQIE